MNSWVYVVCGCVFAVAFVTLVIMLIKTKKEFHDIGFYQNDELTALGNKKYIKLCFERKLDNAYRTKYYLTYFSVDINKLESHYDVEQVDDLQKQSAKIINRATSDFEFCSRIDNGVFVCIFRCIDQAHAVDKATAIVDLLNRSEGELFKDYRTHFRAGIFRLTNKKESFEVALANSKLGYVHATENKVNVCVCTEDILKNESLRNRTRDKLSLALDRGEFEMYVQFIYDVKKKKFTSVEALSRWNSPEDGLLTPAYYINDIRKSGIIDRFDYYMIEKACKLLEEWKKNGVDDMKLSCNITRITISAADFLDMLKFIVEKYDFRHEDLILEITEDALVDNSAMAYQNIVNCKSEGFQIALDDFGAGHSSVSDLCDYPVDVIKVDRHIITKSVTERGEELLQGLINLAHRLNIEVLCEGVETKEENAVMLKNNCDYIQGYYYSYVFPLDQAKEFYQKHNKKATSKS